MTFQEEEIMLIIWQQKEGVIKDFLNLMEVRRFLPMHQWEDFAFTDEFLSAYPQFAPITVKIHRDGEFLGEL